VEITLVSVGALHHVRLHSCFYKRVGIEREFTTACVHPVAGCERGLTILSSTSEEHLG